MRESEGERGIGFAMAKSHVRHARPLNFGSMRPHVQRARETQNDVCVPYRRVISPIRLALRLECVISVDNEEEITARDGGTFA